MPVCVVNPAHGEVQFRMAALGMSIMLELHRSNRQSILRWKTRTCIQYREPQAKTDTWFWLLVLLANICVMQICSFSANTVEFNIFPVKFQPAFLPARLIVSCPALCAILQFRTQHIIVTSNPLEFVRHALLPPTPFLRTMIISSYFLGLTRCLPCGPSAPSPAGAWIGQARKSGRCDQYTRSLSLGLFPFDLQTRATVTVLRLSS